MAAGAFLPITPWSPEIYKRGTLSIPEKASSTYKRGAPLVLNGGYIEEAGTAPSTVKYIAAEDGHNGASDGTYNGLVYTIMPTDFWEATAEDSLAQADIGGNYGIVKDGTTKFWYVDDGDTGDQVSVVQFVQTPDLGAIGDTKARVLIKFDSANIAGF